MLPLLACSMLYLQESNVNRMLCASSLQGEACYSEARCGSGNEDHFGEVI